MKNIATNGPSKGDQLNKLNFSKTTQKVKSIEHRKIGKPNSFLKKKVKKTYMLTGFSKILYL